MVRTIPTDDTVFMNTSPLPPVIVADVTETATLVAAPATFHAAPPVHSVDALPWTVRELDVRVDPKLNVLPVAAMLRNTVPDWLTNTVIPLTAPPK